MELSIPHNKKLLTFLMAILCLVQMCYAQEGISYSYNYGKIVIHNPAISNLSAGSVNGITVNYTLPGYLGISWRSLYNYPDLGISLNIETFNSPEITGNSYALRGFLNFSFFKKKRVYDLGFRASTGLNYITKKYDPIRNPLNQAIGSHININGEARLFARIYTKSVYYEYSFGFNHFSNGLFKAPNLGINVMNSNFSVGGKLLGSKIYENPKQPVVIPFIKNEFWAFVSAGLKEIEDIHKKYTFSGLSVNYSRQVSKINKLGIGIDFSNNSSLTTLAVQFHNYSGHNNLNFRTGINIHNEFVMGNFGVFSAYGLYPGNIDFYSSRVYYKTGFKYYFNNIIGVILIRAIPLFRAEVIEFGVGYRFTEYKNN